MVIGVPLVPAVLLSLATLLPVGWMVILKSWLGALVMILAFFCGFIWMRIISKRDPWRTKQELMRLRLRSRQGNKEIQGGISYGPLRFKKRRVI